MSKDKNFKINRGKTPKPLQASDVKIGDIFEREGSLHIRVQPAIGGPPTSDVIFICNLNTGAVWDVPRDEIYTPVLDCEINYNIKG